ncbi:MAG: N-6 DNA methylase, partial [Chloroflexi bacterium]|nr:N-6 DNA methylase [Chloroflexota bacterium]
IEVDLGAIFRDEMFADFTATWLLIHATRFGAEGAPASDCALERWREARQRAGTAARNRLRGNVEEALVALGQGFLDANPDLRTKLDGQGLSMQAWFEQILRLVYRLIFLAVAEDRDLLHTPGAPPAARSLYENGYGFAYLRDRSARRSAHDHHHDAWEGAKIVFGALQRGEKLLGLPALGALFARGFTPDLDDAKLPNRAFLAAIFKLSWLMDDNRRVRINWRDMATEELGSVYEGLLELVPVRENHGRSFAFAGGAEAKGNLRKISGSYYTPDSLVQALLDSALDPVLDRAEAEGGVEAILDLKVIDPACGSGHFLLGAARRMATRVAQLRDSDAPDYPAAMRDVVRSCIHGVDRNPMAVELTKVALWIETVEPGKPLGFLDVNIRCGDSLLGVFDLAALGIGIPDSAYKALTGDDKETAKHFAKRNKAERDGQGSLDFGEGGGKMPALRPLGRTLSDFRALPEDTVAEIAKKERRFAALQSDPARYDLDLAAEIYTAAFLCPKTGGVPQRPGAAMIPTTAHVWEAMAGRPPYGPLTGRVVDLARDARAFHWPLEFPDMMARGGFDVVLGNPPWERIKLQEKEFFAARDPEIASAPNKAARARLIAALADAEPGTPQRALFDAFEAAKRETEAVSAFVRVDGDQGGRFPLTGRGDVNTYALFAELFARLAGPKGRAGVIVPTGIATDATTAPFFGSLISKARLVSLFSFFEIRKIFLATDDRNPFCLITIGQSDRHAEFVFSLPDVSALDERERRFRLSGNEIAAINPNTRTAPVFRSQADAELTAKIYARVPVLIDEGKGAAGNPWGVSFMAMFHMSGDSGLFRTAAKLAEAGFVRNGTDWLAEGTRPRQAAMALAGGRDVRGLDLQGGGPRGPRRYVPLYEAKMIHQFDHRWASYAENGANSRDVTLGEKADLAIEPTPRYWIPEANVDARLATKGWTRGWLMGWRDICRSTDERTMIGAPIPTTGCGDKYLLIFPAFAPQYCGALAGNMSSLVADFVVRQKLGGTSFKYFTMRQIPFLAPAFYTDSHLTFIVPRVLELTYTSHAMAPFARDLGHSGPPFGWDEDRRAYLRAELDAFYARAYGLTRDELRYILDPADAMGADYPSETFRVLKKNDIKRFGEYRTARLVLAAWDRMERDGDFARLGL